MIADMTWGYGEHSSRSRRGRGLGRATVIAGCLAVVVCAGVTLVRCATPDAVADSGDAVFTAVPLTGSAAITEDDLTVVYSTGAACTDAELTAEDSPTQVTLTLSESDDNGLAECARYASVFPIAAQAELRTPLAGRPLVDSVSGRRIPYLSETDLLRPRFPMKDWETPIGSSSAADPWAEVTTTMAYFGGPDAATLVENFDAIGTIGQLAIVQTTGGWHPPPGTPTTPVTVRGHRGLAARGIIVWTESGRTVAVLGSRTPPLVHPPTGPPERYPAGTPEFGGGDALATAQLLDIAATLIGRP